MKQFIKSLIFSILLSILRKFKSKKIDTWNQEELTILLNVNLISNISFGINATHTTSNSEFSKLISHEVIAKNHSLHVKINKEANEFTSRLMFSQKIISARIINKIKRFIK